MSRRWRIRLTLATIAALLWLAPAPDAAATEIWFGPNIATTDFPRLFARGAPWAAAASRVSTFAVPGQVLDAPLGPDGLARLVAGLKTRAIALAVGMLPLTPGADGCGGGVEGYSAPEQPLADATRFKAAGADIRYVMLDSPLFYGAIFDGPHACHSPIVDIAKDVARKVAQVQSVYPGVPIGDAEPIGIADPQWLADLEVWFDAYEAATGHKLAFLVADMQWTGAWRQSIPPLIALLRRKGIQLQVIYDGDPTAVSDRDWMDSAVRHFKQYESLFPPPPVIDVMSWNEHLIHNLPDNDPKALTNLILQYAAWHDRRR